MAEILKWPDEFTNTTPLVTFSDDFLPFLDECTGIGATVAADKYWSYFAIRESDRMVEFIRRGRLKRGQPQCWEVRLTSDGREIQLGRVFGIREYACVVTAGFSQIRTVTEMWLNRAELKSIIAAVPFWDRMNAATELDFPDSERAK